MSISQKDLYKAEIICDSIGYVDPRAYGMRLTSFLIRYPRFILAEINTHKGIAKSTASSRAIPVAKRIAQVREAPVEPIFYGKNQRGMQASTSVDNAHHAKITWRRASVAAALYAEEAAESELHKGLANRLIEPFVFVESILTADQLVWENHFALRCSESAQPEYDYLAGVMLEQYILKKPVVIEKGGWHIPFGYYNEYGKSDNHLTLEDRLKVSAARCARTSYNTHLGEFSLGSDLKLASQLLESGHYSPYEHQACFSPGGPYGGQFGGGWQQYRKMLPNECRRVVDPIVLYNQWFARQVERGILEP